MDQLSRRSFVRQASVIGAVSLGEKIAPNATAAADPPSLPPHPYFTPQEEFGDVSRGEPEPHRLTGEARGQARLTEETWRLEITADPFVEPPNIKVPATLEHPRTIADGTALDLPQLMELAAKYEVHCVKGIQCLNISEPLGQGLWTGVPLRDVLRSCGAMGNVRRIYYRGFHNHDPAQIFQSSLSYADVMETPPGEAPVLLAYRLNGEPISPKRGGPVRMLVPWAHGFKSIKWLQQIFLTNDYRANDTYATQNNDPEAYLKTAAYAEAPAERVQAGEPLQLRGRVIVGRSGLKRVEYWLRPVDETSPKLEDDSEELLSAPWQACELQPEPDWKAILPAGLSANRLVGFDQSSGKPLTWPLRYTTASFFITLRDPRPGKYELRARAVDLNDFAQPEPCPAQKTGRNSLLVRRFEVV